MLARESLALLSLVALATASVVPVEVRRDYPPPDLVVRDAATTYTSDLAKRFDKTHTYDLSWSAQDQTIFSGKWTSGSDNVALSLECFDCRTWGTVLADFKTDTDSANISLTFHGFGAYFSLGASLAAQGTYSRALGYFRNPPHNGNGVTVSVNIGLDIMLMTSAKVDIDGGFQLQIPDGEQMWLDVNALTMSAKHSSTPKVNFGLLPFSLTDASVSGNLALRLRAEAEVDVNAGGNSASAGAGAYLILTEAKFGAAHDPSSSCKDLIAIDVDANGGAFAEAGYKIGTSSRIIGPSTTTTFYSTHITTCLATGSPTLHKTSAAIQTVAQAPDCATDLTTLTTAITTTYALTSCLVQQINCPASYAQIVQVVNTETVTTTSCPAAKPTASSDDGPLTDAPQIPVAPATLNNLAPLPTVDGSGIVASLGSITAATPAQPTITGEFVPITASGAGRAGGNGWVLLMGAPVAVAAFMAFM